jgi:hypothetical protein
MESVIGGLVVAYIADLFQLYVSPGELLQFLGELVTLLRTGQLSQGAFELDFTVTGGFLAISVAVAYCWGYLFHAFVLDE